jgi:hypothetical protein
MKTKNKSGETDERGEWLRKSEETMTKAWGNPADDVFNELHDWPFDQATNVAAVTTRQVIEDGLPVLSVTHYLDDDSWAFVCGINEKTEDGRVIGMGDALKLDPTLRTVADLPPGWTAWREAVGGTWQRFQNEKT